MLKEVFASNIAKLVAACVCPVVGASAVALKVPPVRSALHKATSPKQKPEREARAKPRVRTPIKPAFAKKKDGEEEAQPFKAAMMCPQAVDLNDSPLQSASLDTTMTSAPDLRVTAPAVEFRPVSCPSIRMGGGGMFMGIGAVPEPATWMQMVAGFALLGAAVRVGRRLAPVTSES